MKVHGVSTDLYKTYSILDVCIQYTAKIPGTFECEIKALSALDFFWQTYQDNGYFSHFKSSADVPGRLLCYFSRAAQDIFTS
jgi:hypothetical protein